MKTLLLWILSVSLVCGCANANRTHLDAGEPHYEFTIYHQICQHPAFLKVEQALAEMDLGSTSLTQSETGNLLLRPEIPYRVGGPLGVVEYAHCILRINVSDSKVVLLFQLGPAEDTGSIVYPPKTKMPQIRARFDAIAGTITGAVNGSLQAPKVANPITLQFNLCTTGG